jgi:hypothetical protein
MDGVAFRLTIGHRGTAAALREGVAGVRLGDDLPADPTHLPPILWWSEWK